jgi:cell division protein FtsL
VNLSKLDVLLVLALILSGLALVRTSYEARRLYAAVDKARAEQRQLDAEFKRLDAERQAQATHLRVEKVARDKLAMRPATPAVTHYVADRPVSAPTSSATAAVAAAAGALR